MFAPPLAELQRLFWASIAAEPGSGPDLFDHQLLDVIEPSATLTPRARLAIYADMYLARLTECLRGDFPRVAELLGDEAWNAVTREFFAVHPSKHPSVRHLGGAFPGFLADHPPANSGAALAELARFEWVRRDVFDAPDAHPLTRADLMSVVPERWGALRFQTVPACALFDSPWPIHRLWSGDSPLDAAQDPCSLRIWRQGFMVYHAPMRAPEATAMRHLMAGAPFGAICEAMADVIPQEDAAPAVVGWLSRWVEDGLLAAADLL